MSFGIYIVGYLILTSRTGNWRIPAKRTASMDRCGRSMPDRIWNNSWRDIHSPKRFALKISAALPASITK